MMTLPTEIKADEFSWQMNAFEGEKGSEISKASNKIET